METIILVCTLENGLSEIYRVFLKTYLISFCETTERYPSLLLKKEPKTAIENLNKVVQNRALL